MNYQEIIFNTNNKLKTEKKFWDEKLKGLGEKCTLRYDRHPAEGKTGEVWETITWMPDNYLYEKSFLKLCNGSQPHLYILLLSAWQLTISKYNQEEEVVVQTPALGNTTDDKDAALLYIRTVVDPAMTLKAFLMRVQELVSEANQHPHFLSFDIRDNIHSRYRAVSGISFSGNTPVETDKQTDVTCSFLCREASLEITIRYNAALYDRSTINRLGNYFLQLLNYYTGDLDVTLSKLEILTAAEKEHIRQLLDNTQNAWSAGQTLMDLFDAQVLKTPGNTAVMYRGNSLTYAALQEKANAMAIDLLEKGITRGSLVGILLEPSDMLLVAVLGILKAGAAYVPIDNAYPMQRKQYIVNNSGFSVLISTDDLIGAHLDILQHISLSNLIDVGSIAITPAAAVFTGTSVATDDLAYVLYTSGSTGRPKGVMIAHGALLNYLNWASDIYISGSDCHMALFTSIAFDLTVTSVFLPLINGNTVYVYDQTGENLPVQQVVADGYATVIKLTPSHLKVLCESPESLAGIKRIIVGGEHFESTLAQRLFEKTAGQTEIYNEYGPTEATVGCVLYKYMPHQIAEGNYKNVLIGKPAANTRIYILDKYGNIAPCHMPGELYIGGAQLFMGYIASPEQTAQRLLADPFLPGEKMYRTGDLACWQEDGNIMFLGRVDEQVKIRGYRIELGEIEVQLSGHPQVKSAVIAVKERTGHPYLVAYYISDEKIAAQELKNYLSQELPEYMVPLYYIQIDSIPLTSNGKTDRRSLPDPELAAGENFVAPVGEKEERLVAIWSEVLGLKTTQISTTASFFELGGDSIKSIQLAAKVYKLGYAISVQDILTYATIGKLAPVLKELQQEIVQTVSIGATPLAPIQQWFFAKQLTDRHHYNQSVILQFPADISRNTLQDIFTCLTTHHDALRMVYRFENGAVSQWQQEVPVPIDLWEADISDREADMVAWLNDCNAIQSGINLEQGPLLKLGLFHLADGCRLLIVIHHLVVDGISWRILLEDIDTLYKLQLQGKPLELPLKTHAYQQWTTQMTAYRQQPSFLDAAAYWTANNSRKSGRIVPDFEAGENTIGLSQSSTVTFSREDTSVLLREAHRAFNTQVPDLLLAALVMAYNKVYTSAPLLLDMEGHGREEVMEGLDVSRTVGWFTSIYPVWLEAAADTATTIKQVKETLRGIPNKGFDYLLNKYAGTGAVPAGSSAQISFNYLGQFDTDISQRSYVIANVPHGNAHSVNNEREYEWEIMGIISSEELRISLIYSVAQYNPATIQQFLTAYKNSLEEVITHCRQQALTAPQLTPSDLTYRKLSVAALDQLQQQYDISDIYPLSPMQEGMLFHALLDGTSQQYFEQVSYRLHADLKVSLIADSLQYLMDRYDILRTLFTSRESGRNLQVVLKHRAAAFTSIDIRQEITTANKEQVLESYRRKDRQQTFDLGSDVLIRVMLLRVDEQEYEFVWSFHHILMDGWCLSTLVKEFSECYYQKLEHRAPQLPPVVPYGQFIKWLEARDQAIARTYWKTYLADYEMPTGIPRSNDANSNSQVHADQEIYFTLTKEQTAALQFLASRNSVTLNTVIQAVWAVLLSKYNNTKDVLFGAVVSGRPAEIAGIESMVGLFINTIPVRIRLEKEETFTRLFKKVQADAIAGIPYHYSPLAEVQALSPLKRGLLDHILVFENYPIARELDNPVPAAGYLKTSHHSVYEQTSYGLTISIIPGETCTFKFQYDGERYAPWMIPQVSRHFRMALENVTQPDILYVTDLDILPADEQQMLIHDFNAKVVSDPPFETVMDLFDAQVLHKKGQVAVCFEDNNTITYGDLGRRVEEIAGYLQQQGIGKGDVVAILMSHSIELITAILGVIKSGAAYLPIDRNTPAERISYMIANSGASCVLMNEDIYTAGSPGVRSVLMTDIGAAAAYIPVIHTPGDLCYIIYTSGSTGLPKGVMITHGALGNYLNWANDTYMCGETQAMALFTSVAFDLAVTAVFLPLITGNTLYVYDQAAAGLSLHKVVADGRVAVFKLTPSHLSILCERPGSLHGIKRIIVGGEQFSDHLAARVYEKMGRKVEIYNEYGPTEATVGCVLYRYDPQQAGLYQNIPIGRPVANTRIYILDASGQLVPCGVPGELFIAGAQLFSGYIGEDEQTRQRLLPDPFQATPAQMYRSGDLACWLPDGNVMYLGRIDNQVKLHGYRIEPGEIETQLLQHAGINTAVVALKGKGEQSCLVAYYTGDLLTTPELKSYLSGKLPVYMIPSFYIQLDSIPLTSNGKINYRVLPDPVQQAAGGYLQPVNDTEEKLLQLWSEVLSLNKELIGLEANFFELGGNSILITRLTTVLQQAFNIPVTVADVFRLTNIRDMALFIRGEDTFLLKEQAQLKEAGKGKNSRLNILKELKKA